MMRPAPEETESPRIAKDFGPSSRRAKAKVRRPLHSAFLHNEKDEPKDKQDWGFFFRVVKPALCRIRYPFADVGGARPGISSMKLVHPGHADARRPPPRC